MKSGFANTYLNLERVPLDLTPSVASPASLSFAHQLIIYDQEPRLTPYTIPFPLLRSGQLSSYMVLHREKPSVVVVVLQVARGTSGVSLTKVPYFDVEVRNVYGLRFMAQTLFAPPKDA